jgi:hypothetical protein
VTREVSHMGRLIIAIVAALLIVYLIITIL